MACSKLAYSMEKSLEDAIRNGTLPAVNPDYKGPLAPSAIKQGQILAQCGKDHAAATGLWAFHALCARQTRIVASRDPNISEAEKKVVKSDKDYFKVRRAHPLPLNRAATARRCLTFPPPPTTTHRVPVPRLTSQEVKKAVHDLKGYSTLITLANLAQELIRVALIAVPKRPKPYSRDPKEYDNFVAGGHLMILANGASQARLNIKGM